MGISVIYDTFNKYVLSGLPIDWCNRFGIMKLDDAPAIDRVVEFRLETNGTMGTYSGYRVSIIHKRIGVVSSHFFNFNDVMTPADRIDDRQSGEHRLTGNFSILDHCLSNKDLRRGSSFWYICVPSDEAVKRYRDNIANFIESYKW